MFWLYLMKKRVDCTWWRNVCWAYLMKKRVLSVPDEETCVECTWWRHVCWVYLMKTRVLSVPDEETCVECTWWRNVWYVFNYISTFLTTLQCTFRYQHGLISFQEPSKLKHKLINTCAFQKNCFNSSSKTDRNCFKY